ncbi:MULTISPECIES: manganese-dependent inorganic pyrophosphatase [Haloferacaceae]|jgi:manganese-dependent inorganic pyrophosphatase|uniref:inorganic diphosphatase n=1 Tax=Halohasta litchfieldiae TaxID=1073996 RepID=A0A1H6U450_9EURY|nr:MULTISPECIES: manganese-dependent inorganic pyrophosphatase [Halorubraceae]ATW89106.1 manganese-dependent inorganic pyrophosphatase [Halohasta litchfieldiae]MCG1008218.1 manganese-dependent inorganic pyrophosphatase [Halorubrum lacusprofundi]SEI87061.1 manganese-dependent inorganic pyrophosphatase [Halohasta litchfieldiae]
MDSESTVVVGHTRPDADSVCSAIAFAALKSAEGTPTTPLIQGPINAESEYLLERFEVSVPEERRTVGDYDVILVDHSERDQAPEDLSPDQLRGIVDHHRIGDLQSSRPAFYFADVVGCTATLIHELAERREVSLDRSTRGLMLGAILSDTMLLASPTTTDRDRDASAALAESLAVDREDFGQKQFEAKSTVGSLPPSEALKGDLKVYDTSHGAVAIGQIEVADSEAILTEKGAYIEAMEQLQDEGDYHGVVLLVTDIPAKGSHVLVVSTDDSAYESALDITLSDRSQFVDGLLSRKKQVVPPLLEAFGSSKLT